MSALDRIDPATIAADLDTVADDIRACAKGVYHNAARAKGLMEQAALLLKPPRARPRSEWDESNGDVLWWRFPIEEAPFCGTPLGDDWPEDDGYYTHWTPIVLPERPPCELNPDCIQGFNHEGECDDIPF